MLQFHGKGHYRETQGNPDECLTIEVPHFYVNSRKKLPLRLYCQQVPITLKWERDARRLYNLRKKNSHD